MSRIVANLLLLTAAFVWGSVFIAQRWASELIGPFLFNGSRFTLGALLLIPLAWTERQRTPLRITDIDRSSASYLFGVGVVLGLGSVLQQFGVGLTSIANAGFLTTLYVPLVPIIAFLFLRQDIPWIVWPSVALCLIGTYLLAGPAEYDAKLGDIVIIISAVFFAAHILLIQAVMRRFSTPFQASLMQAATAGVVTLVCGVLFESVDRSMLLEAAPYIAYGAFMSVFLGFTLQLMAQQHTGASTAAIILSLEAVFAAFLGWLVLGEVVPPLGLVGCGLIFLGVLLVEMWPRSAGSVARS